jgi:NAD(P)-dependent dehydrogenase (short-subunit alcohol dehydrogenase family)
MSPESVSAPAALVTRADKGIGLETAQRLAGAGYRVYLTAQQRGRAAAATAGVRQSCGSSRTGPVIPES